MSLDTAEKTLPTSITWKHQLSAIGLYALLTLFFAWPAVANLNNGTPGNFYIDRNQYLWNLWWFKRSLFETHSNPFITNLLYYPYGVQLFLHSLSPYNLIVGLPIQNLFGIIPTFGFLMLLGFPTSAYGAYLLSLYLLRDYPNRHWGALLAGLIWSFSAYHYAVLRTEWLNLVALQWIPLFILLVFKLKNSADRRNISLNVGLAVAVFLLGLLTDYYYSLFVLVFIAMYWLKEGLLALVRSNRQRLEPVKAFAWFSLKLGLVFGLTLLIFSPIWWPTLKEIGDPNYEATGNVTEANTHITDLVQFFLPPRHQPWWGGNFELWHNLGNAQLNNWGAVMSYVGLAFSIVALLKFRGLWFWVVSAIFWLILSGGVVLQLNGNNTGIPLPGKYIFRLPLFNIVRFPERYILMFQLSLTVLAGFGLVYLLNRLPQIKLAGRLPMTALIGGVVLALAFLESWPGILPAPTPIPTPSFLSVVAASNSDSGVEPSKAIFELPMTKHGTFDSWRMYYQTFHARPILGGYISRDPVDPYRFRDFALADWVEPLPVGTPDIVPAKTGPQTVGLLNSLNVGYVVIYPNDYNQNASRLERAKALVRQSFGAVDQNLAKPIYTDELAEVYRVPKAEIKEAVLVLGPGWSDTIETVDKDKGIYQRWLAEDSPQAQVVIPVGSSVKLATGYRLDYKVVSPDKPRRLQVRLNGQKVSEVMVQKGLNDFQLTGISLQPGNNVIAFVPDAADGYFVPAEAKTSNDKRKLRLAFTAIQLVNA